MKLICIEEHTVDLAMNRETQPLLLDQAPGAALQTSGAEASAPHDPHTQSRIRMADAIPLGVDLGERRIANMDAHGVDMQVVSHIAQPQLLPTSQAIALSRAANDRLAQAARERPDRLAGFAVLPWQDADAACAELKRAVQELGFPGALLTGRPGKRFLDEARYAPILAAFAELESRSTFTPSIRRQASRASTTMA